MCVLLGGIQLDCPGLTVNIATNTKWRIGKFVCLLLMPLYYPQIHQIMELSVQMN